MGMLDSNPQVFAAPNSSTGTLRACDEIRKFSKSCQAKHPQHLRSTLLRKQFASMRQLDNLDTNEMDIIADFMGHDITVHREYYR